jgi:putative phosphoesterase
MRIALVSDIHGNLTALDAVVDDIARRGVDRVVQGGDLALMGPRPAEVIDRIRELGWPGIVGNTDEAIWRPEEHERLLNDAPALKPMVDLIFQTYVPDARERLGDDRIGWMRELPAEHREADLALVHARPGDLWRAPMPEADDDELAGTYRPLEAGLAVYGHIHKPYVREVDGLTVANSGSVGLPFDDDPRAAYLIVDDGKPSIVRVEYDVEREVRALRESGHPDADRLSEMRRTGSFIPPA